MALLARKSFFCAVILIPLISNAALVEIDFNSLSEGVEVTSQFSSSGVTFELLGATIPGPTTTSLQGSDIFGATGMAIAPGDDVFDPFWDIQLTFNQSIDYFSILALNAEEVVTLEGYKDGALMQSITQAEGTFLGKVTEGDVTFRGPVYLLELGLIDGVSIFDRVVINVTKDFTGTGNDGGPEQFDNIAFNVSAVPLPPALWLFGSGLLGFVGMARRRKQP
jgi:hypothetical protein